MKFQFNHYHQCKNTSLVMLTHKTKKTMVALVQCLEHKEQKVGVALGDGVGSKDGTLIRDGTAEGCDVEVVTDEGI